MNLVGILVFLFASVVSGDIIQVLSGRIHELDQVFLQKGPTISILQSYDSIISEINKLNQTDESFVNFEVKYLPNLYYKKGLIEFSIDKELFAIESFEKCYKLNKSFDPCKEKLVQLYLKNGRLNKLRQMSNDVAIHPSTMVELKQLESSINESQLAASSKNYTRCFEKLSEAISISPSFNELRLRRIECLENSLEFGHDIKLHTLIDDYTELIKNGQYSVSKTESTDSGMFDKFFKRENDRTDVKPLGNFVNLFKLLLFGSKEFDKSQKFLQKCLRVDNDYIECQQYSKLYVKLSKFWSVFEKISIYYSHIYFKREDEEQSNEDEGFNIENFEINESEWKYVYNFLFNRSEKLKLTKQLLQVFGLKDFENNFELIFHELSKYSTDFKFVKEKLELSSKINSDFYSQNSFTNDFLRLAIESILVTKSIDKHQKFVRESCVCISSTSNDDSSKFLPCEILNIDALLSKPNKKDYMRALKILKSMRPRLRKTQLWISRYKKIESKYPSDNRRQQQNQHQQQRFQQQYQNSHQHQQFFNQQQQRQQQQLAPPQQFPDTDFYKVLEVPKTADDQTIKKAYRDKVRQYHPDKNKNSEFNKDELEQKMSDINNAYEVLSDKEKRQQYDLQRQGQGQPRFRQQQQPRYHQQQQQHHHQQQQFFQGGGGDFFNNIFRHLQQQQNRRGSR